MKQGAQIIASAIAGSDFRNVVVGGKVYVVESPTIYRLSGAIACLSAMSEGTTMREMLTSVGEAERLCEALSFFIRGNKKLAGTLARTGTMAEVITALEECFEMLDVGAFMRAVSLMKSVQSLAVKPQ